MAKQRMINTRFWDDNYTSNLDPIEKLLFLYVLTNTSTNICGVYEIPLKKIATETGIDRDAVIKVLERFAADDKVYYSDGWIIVKNFVKNQNHNPSVEKGIQRELESVPEHIKELFLGQGGTECSPIYNHKQVGSHQRERILKRDDYCCKLCNSKDLLEIDHITPVYAGGQNKDDNLRVLCRKCNISRNKEYYDSLSQPGTPNLTKLNLTKPNLIGGENTPRSESIKFFEMINENSEDYVHFLVEFSKRVGIDEKLAGREVKKFADYWCERTLNGKKMRWETEKTFQVQRRLAKWFSNTQQWSKEKTLSRGKAIV